MKFVPEQGNNDRLLIVLLPIVIVVVCTMLLPAGIRSVLPGASPTTGKLLAMLAGLVISLGLIGFASRRDSTFRLFSQYIFTENRQRRVYPGRGHDLPGHARRFRPSA